jgi:trehalose 6-phosphate phosphatase
VAGASGADPRQLHQWLAPLLAGPGRAVLAVDYDGTLAPIVMDPAEAYPAPGAVQALADLAGRLGTMAVISGRPAADVVRVGGLEQVPGLVVLGLYGEQRWEAGQLAALPAPSGLAAALAEVPAVLAAAGPAAAGATVETKGASFAVHVRRAGDPAAALELLREPLGGVASRHGLALQPGRLVLELRRPGTDKGSALADLVAERAALAGASTSAVLYAGDDVGDLPAFATVAALRLAGVPAWAVAAASPEAPELADAADVVVDGPAGVVALLRAVAGLLSGPVVRPAPPADG